MKNLTVRELKKKIELGIKQNQFKDAVPFLIHILILIILIALATGIGYFFLSIDFQKTNIVLVYLLVVLIMACFSKGYTIGIIASIMATLAFNYFFTSPYISLSVDDPSYIVTLIIMTITAFIASTLTFRVKQSAWEAREKEAETKALYTLTNRLTVAKDMDMIAGIAAGSISECFSCRAACLYFDETDPSPQTFLQQVSPGNQVRRKLENAKEIREQMESLQTGHNEGTEFWDWPIYGRESILGVVRIPCEDAMWMSETKLKLLQPMIESTALAMDRFQSVLHQMKAHEETMQERYRANILRAISHDLRTPLSGIIGTSEMLMDMTEERDPRYSLAEGIHKDADWLHSLVENILSLTRLQDGKMTIHKEPEAVEEIVGGAVGHIAKRYPGREIAVKVPEELLMVPMDAKLIQQVLVNLLDNAVQQTLEEQEISIQVTKDLSSLNAVFSIFDCGKGIKDENIDVIFQAFYTSRAKRPDAQRGIGLGLTICEAIVNAHGGSIEARNRIDTQGAEFLFKLPLQ